MARTFVATCAAAVLGVALTASAQQPPQPQPSQPTPPSQTAPPAQASATLDREVKLSGCLKAGTAPGSFELATGKKDRAARGADATTPAQPPASPSSQAPTQDAMAKAASANVKLMAKTGVDLAPHLNHQVEVTGTWDAASAGAASAAGGDMAKAGKTLNVSNLKMVSATCTSGTS
jgi:hypothetical protein